MATRPGEEMVATLFADVHYFYSPEEATKPRHHRFDKGSYVYLYENAGARRARVEIANHPGTDDQDAFEGSLDNVTLRYGYKHSCLVTLIVGQHQQQTQQQPSDPNEWHLPTYDPRNENKYHYPLHSLDVYFWTRADALQFVNGARRVLPTTQCEILDEPAASRQQQQQHAHNEMSAVVQQLENVAISGNGVTPAAGGGALPPPAATGDFVPMAYNPAAPAAPEAVMHREKTPPPPQDPSTDPRVMAVAYEQGQQVPGQPQPFSPAPFSPYFPHHQQPLASPAFAPQHLQQQNQQPLASPGFMPPPPPPTNHQQPLASPGFSPPQQPLANPGFAPAGHTQFQRTNTLPVPGSPGFFPGAAGAAGTPPQPMQSMYAGMASPPQQAAAATTGAAAAAPTPPPQQQAQQTQTPPQQGQEYGVHHQVYVPETPGSSSSSIRKDSNAGRLERGVSGMFKKFEKKFG